MDSKSCAWCERLYERNPKFSDRQWAASTYCSRACSKAAHRPSLADTEARFWDAVDKSAGATACWPWTKYVAESGHGIFVAARHWAMTPGTRQIHAARFALSLTVGQNLGEAFACHRCNNAVCCNPSHLYVGDAQSNFDDARAAGTWKHHPAASGEQNHLAKLTDHAVRAIRDRYAAGGTTQRALAQEHGVTQRAILAVIRRETWKHVN